MRQPRVAADDSLGVPLVTPEIAAEAAVWVARLHGPDRSPRMERECLAWQARSAAHRRAFECCTETWQDVPRVTLASAFAASNGERAPVPAVRAAPLRWAAVGWAVALVVTGLLVGGALFVQQRLDRADYATAVGEQRQVLLDDGTRMTLNTDSRVHVDLEAAQRTVRVHAGEALFEVAKDAQRPFVVLAGGTEVVALGTTFAVRLAPGHTQAQDRLAVTLIEGLVTVRSAPTQGRAGVAPGGALLMQPGDRVRIASTGQAGTSQVDRPSIEQVMAWRRSEVVFDETTLVDAVTEMNRYSRTPIMLVEPSRLAELRVSGVYRTGDNAAFARAVATLHSLNVLEYPGRLEVVKAH